MPKGGLLHVHLDATVNAVTLFELALQHPAIHIRVPNVLNSSTISSTLPEFRGLPEFYVADHTSLTDPSYLPNSWVPLHKAMDNFDPILGGPHGFKRWALSAMMISPSEAYETHKTAIEVRPVTITSPGFLL
jgi:adenosine deaminase CECR1